MPVKKAKRHQSLIPLSREHHYALMLCLRINRGLTDNSKSPEWLQEKSGQVSRFFQSDLVAHFKAEEEVVFPAMHEIAEARALILELCEDHRRLENLVQQIVSADSSSLAEKLREFARVLEAHIRKEERLLFPLYEKEAAALNVDQVERDVLSIVGTALEPKNAESFEP